MDQNTDLFVADPVHHKVVMEMEMKTVEESCSSSNQKIRKLKDDP